MRTQRRSGDRSAHRDEHAAEFARLFAFTYVCQSSSLYIENDGSSPMRLDAMPKYGCAPL